MKKFLLLLVGVLFALSAKADWTFYVDISGTDWTEAPYFYAGHDEQFYEAKQCSTTSVEGIYKVTFKGWNDLAELYICKSKLVNTECTKAQIEAAGTANVDWFGKFSTTAYSQPEYGFDSDNSKTPLFKLTKGSNGASITVNYDPNATDPSESTVVYKYSGDETDWADNGGAKELALTDNGDGTYSLTRTFANNKNFGIREYTNGSQTAWYYGVKGRNTINTVGQTYNAVTSDGSNWSFQLTAGEYTLTFNPTAKTIVFTSTATPTVETAYTIYFDAVRSGSAWANPRLTLGGVEVIGTTDGSLIKYAFHAAAGAKIAFSNGSTTSDPLALANNTVYYVDKNAIASASKTGYSYSPTHEFTYRVHGQITTGSWTDIPMTYYPDGTWRTAATKFVDGGFGIQKLDKNGNQYKENNSNDYGWIYCSSTTNYTMSSFGVKSKGTIKAGNSGHDWAIADKSELDNKKEYVLVFDPEAMTIMFINPVAATAKAEPVEVTTTSHVNKLSVNITASEYTSATGSFTLTNGTFTATSETGASETITFENVPYASNYTLTPEGGAALPINITMPAEPPFDISAVTPKVFAPADGQTKGILSVAFTVSTTWAYNLPHVICTCGGKVVPGNVEWSEGGFTFSAAEAVPLDGTNIADDMTFKFVITPEYPFMVNAASPRGQMRVAGTGIQNVLGTAITDAEATLTRANDEVSGVEGLVIEAEDAPVEYFNLQGQRVDGDLAPGIYIRRQGATVTKVRI